MGDLKVDTLEPLDGVVVLYQTPPSCWGKGGGASFSSFPLPLRKRYMNVPLRAESPALRIERSAERRSCSVASDTSERWYRIAKHFEDGGHSPKTYVKTLSVR